MKWFILIFTVFMVSCAEASEPEVRDATAGLIIYEDKDRGVVCYRHGPALSCLKLNPSKEELAQNKRLRKAMGLEK